MWPFKKCDHCFHVAITGKYRLCCHCGREEFKEPCPLPGHGKYFVSFDNTQWVKKGNW